MKWRTSVPRARPEHLVRDGQPPELPPIPRTREAGSPAGGLPRPEALTDGQHTLRALVGALM